MNSDQFFIMVVTAGFGVNITALSWIMKTLFEMRREISSSHSEFRTTQADHDRRLDLHDRRISRLEHPIKSIVQ